jgi:hypothetical protein
MAFKPFPVISGKNDIVLPALDGVFISSPKKKSFDQFFMWFPRFPRLWAQPF